MEKFVLTYFKNSFDPMIKFLKVYIKGAIPLILKMVKFLVSNVKEQEIYTVTSVPQILIIKYESDLYFLKIFSILCL